MLKERLHGVFTPNMVPLDRHQEIDEDELRRYLDWLVESGVHGIYPNGSTGEFTRFSSGERRRIVRIVCEQVAGRVPVLAGAAEANVRETLKACDCYAEYGARAVAIVSPFYYRLSSESVFVYFREIATHSPIDITLYNVPMFASPIDLQTVRRLAEFERVIGIKDSSGDLASMMRMMAAIKPRRPDFVFLTGWEPVLIPMLLMGVNGATIASSGVVPEVTRRIYELTQAGNTKGAIKLQYRLTELFDAMLNAADFPAGFRAGVAARGFEFGETRQSLCRSQREQCRMLSQTLQQMFTDLHGTEDLTDNKE